MKKIYHVIYKNIIPSEHTEEVYLTATSEKKAIERTQNSNGGRPSMYSDFKAREVTDITEQEKAKNSKWFLA